jgi:hypothetical protein
VFCFNVARRKEKKMIIFCIFENQLGKMCSWILNKDSDEKIVIQWAKTFIVHNNVDELKERIQATKFDKIEERDI